MRSFCICMHFTRGSALAAKSDPGVPYMFIRKLPGLDQFWQ